MKTVIIKTKKVIVDGSTIYESKNKGIFKALRGVGVCNCPTLGEISTPLSVYMEAGDRERGLLKVWHPYRFGIGGKLVFIYIRVDE